MKDLIIVFVSFFLLAGCQAKQAYLKPVLETEGEVYVYTQPFPQEAGRLTFSIESISAVRDSAETPLSLLIKEFRGSEMTRQRLIADAILPPGQYSGLMIKVSKATLKTEEGEADLLVPKEPVRINAPFTVTKGKSLLLSLAFKYPESLTGVSFSPFFSAYVPSKPVTGVIGYVSNTAGNNITVFDKTTMQAVSYIATGREPKGIAIDPARKRAYVALYGDDGIDVIDVLSGDVINRIRLNIGDNPQELALTPDGKTLLTVNAGSNTVSFVNPTGLFEISRINVDNGPTSILLDRTGRRAYVFNTIANTMSVIDIPNRAVITSIATDPGPLRGQQNIRGDRLYIVHELSPYMTVLDPQGFTIIKRVYVGFGMSSIKVDTNTDFIYVGRKGGPTVDIFDPFAFTPVDFIRTSEGADYMTIDGEYNNFYMLTHDRPTISIFNLISRRAVSEIDVSDSPYWVTMMGER